MMGEGLLLFVFILLIAGTVSYTIRQRQRSLRSSTEWIIDDVPVGEQKVGVVLKKGSEQFLIGRPVDINDPDFNYKIEERRCEAQERLVAMKHLPYKT